jgi:hypothetical protein
MKQGRYSERCRQRDDRQSGSESVAPGTESGFIFKKSALELDYCLTTKAARNAGGTG